MPTGPTRTTSRPTSTRSQCPQRLRRPPTDPRSRIRCHRDPGGLRLRRPTRRAPKCRGVGLVLDRGPQRDLARPTRQRADTPGHRPGRRRRLARTPTPVRDRDRPVPAWPRPIGPACSPWSSQAAALRPDHRRRGRLPTYPSSKTPRTLSCSRSPPATNTPLPSSPRTCRSPAEAAPLETKPSPQRSTASSTTPTSSRSKGAGYRMHGRGIDSLPSMRTTTDETESQTVNNRPHSKRPNRPVFVRRRHSLPDSTLDLAGTACQGQVQPGPTVIPFTGRSHVATGAWPG